MSKNTGRSFNIKRSLLVTLFVLFAGCNPEPDWPGITKENKPWTRWWWQGSSVNVQGLTAAMEEYKKAGLGGVEITPVYGVAGYEDQFINFLSPQWMEMLEHTLEEGERLGLGVDMATGTGWPFGGPWVNEEDASKYIVCKTYMLQEGERLPEPVRYIQKPLVRAIGTQVYELHGLLKAEGEEPEGSMENPLQRPGSEPVKIEDIKEPLSANENLQSLALEQVRFEKKLPLVTLMAYSEKGETIDLTGQVRENGNLDWTAPEGNWTLYALFRGWHGKMVERAAPGGEGLVIDHFAEEPLRNYLRRFDEAFAGYNISGLRSFFNDSYEVDDAQGQANWTPQFFESFEKRRGYDLLNHLPALFGDGSQDENRRVLSDYRETISDLLLEKFTRQWNQWAGGKGAFIRNQAHGSPANILDLYAASDIPETEGTDVLRAKMASSAANVTGKKLVSSESATWLNEHFLSSLADVKTSIDRFFLGGINHIVYHGTTYSPQNEDWPGWLFYAAVHFNPQNPIWEHFGALNGYVARVQSFLQSGRPDNDVLLYFPIYDQWAEREWGLLEHFDGGINDQFEGTPFKAVAEWMLNRGYGFDYISDRQLQQTKILDNLLQTGNVSYKTILLPKSEFIPFETFEKIMDLANEGATILVYQGLPSGIAGLADLEDKREKFQQLINQLEFVDSGQDGIQKAQTGPGRFLMGDDPDQLLAHARIQREIMVDSGLRFVRRSHDDGNIYFITNWGEREVDGWIPLGVNARSAALYDPMMKRSGFARFRSVENESVEVYLQLDPGESCVLKTYQSMRREASYPYLEKAGNALQLDGTWTVEFTAGGPELPESAQIDELTSWTEFGGEASKNFSGKATYTLSFTAPEGSGNGWELDLGEVQQSARVKLNGRYVGILIGPAYKVFIDQSLFEENNELEIEVANLMANRIAYMDRENIPWKKFYNVNFPARSGSNRNKQGLFDASDWLPSDSGLLGPVTITPVNLME